MYIFVSSIGRSGTKFLSEVFKQVTDIPSFHGGELNIPDMRCCVGDALVKFNNNVEAEEIDRKIKQIQKYSVQGNYFESSQLFLGCFVEKAIKTLHPIYVIHLIRNPLETAKSYVNRNSIPGSAKSVWRPPITAKRNLLQLNEALLTPFQKNLWNWLENELRFHYYKHYFKKTFDLSFDDLNKIEVFEGLFEDFKIGYNRKNLIEILNNPPDKCNFYNANRQKTVISADDIEEAKAFVALLKKEKVKLDIERFNDDFYLKHKFINEILTTLSENNLVSQKKYIVFGDSHAKFFERKDGDNATKVEVYPIPGASIAGFGKRKSTLGTSNRIEQVVKETKNIDKLILKFGQVDVDLGYYYRLVIKNENLNFTELSKRLIDDYVSFIKKIPISVDKICVFGINLPSIFDRENAVNYTSRVVTENIDDPLLIEQYKQIVISKFPSIDIRTKLTLEFNKMLKSCCLDNGIVYTDFISETLDPKTQLLRSCFHSDEDKDKHLKDCDLTRELYLSKLNSLLSKGKMLFFDINDSEIQSKNSMKLETIKNSNALKNVKGTNQEKYNFSNTLSSNIIHIANQLKQQGKIAEALKLYDRITENNPNFSWGYIKKGEALLADNQLNEAIDNFRQALKINPQSATASYNLGLALAKQNSYDAAKSCFRQAIKKCKANVPKKFYTNLWEVLAKQGKRKKTISSVQENNQWRVGVAKVAITPKEPIWMAGYGFRNKPSEGVVHDLWAKAIVILPSDNLPIILVTLDICGLDRHISNQISNVLEKQHGLERDRIVLSFSHTHTGPVVGNCLEVIYSLDREQSQKVAEYTNFLCITIVEVVQQAFENMKPASITWGIGRANFAVNRSENIEKEVVLKRERLNLNGPVDHDVPVLLVRDLQEELIAIIYGYACHCTVLNFYKLSGDYAGFANIALEKHYPGAVAMFVAGCGADQNPIPRGDVSLAQQYGEELAQAVSATIGGGMESLNPQLISAYYEVDLHFSQLPTFEQIKKDAESTNIYVARRAKKLLEQIKNQGSLTKTYPYPIQLWQLGGKLNWIFMAGEAVIGYALGLKLNLGSSHTWVASYCNDLCSYIPTKGVLAKRGYEGDRSMIYYGLPTTWDENCLEEDIINAIYGMVKTLQQTN